MEALQDLCDKLCDLAKEKELLERALQNQQCGEGEGEAGTTEESKESKNLRRVMRATTKEIQLLKKSVPEGLVIIVPLYTLPSSTYGNFLLIRIF